MENVVYRLLFGSPVRIVRTVILIVCGVHLLHFVAIPHLLTRRKVRSPRLRRYLEWVVATPSLLGDVIKIEARHDLMRFAHMESRHEQVAEQGFAILRHSLVPSTMKAEVRRRLAEALEMLGRHEEAAAQRADAEGDLRASDKDASWYITRGRQLTAQRDYAGACQAFEEGLDEAPEGPNDSRALLLAQLSNALFMAGRVEESAQRAEEAIPMIKGKELLYSAHRQAAASYATLGRLDESEPHRYRAVALAEELGDPARLADSLGDLAAALHKRGQLREAIAACDRAAAVRNTRHVEVIRYEIFRAWGNFDEAFAANLRASQSDPNPTLRAEQMMQGIFAYGRAILRMEQGNLDEVSALLQAARAGVKGDPKLTAWCDSADVRFDALSGRSERALQGCERVEPRLAEYVQDRNTRAVFLSNLGRATLALGLYDRALHYWEQYLDLPPTPVDTPVAYYHLGEALRGLGDEAAARDRYRAAVDTGLDTHYTRLADARLRTVLA